MIREHDAALNSSYTDDFKRNPNQAKVSAELGYSSLFFSLLSRRQYWKTMLENDTKISDKVRWGFFLCIHTKHCSYL